MNDQYITYNNSAIVEQKTVTANGPAVVVSAF